MPIEEAAEQNRTDRPSEEFLGLSFDRLDLDETVRLLSARPPDSPFAYLVTPNVDHMVRLFDPADPQHDRLWAAYREAEWCLCDSRILACLAAARGVRLSVVPGSDLAPAILRSGAAEGGNVAVVGSTAEAVDQLRRLFPRTRFDHHAPPFGLRHNDAALDEAAAFVAGAQARFTFLSVGSPQQELLAARIKSLPGATGIGLCLGAAIDFVTGHQKRAPQLVQRLHLEWAHRLLSDPRRLWRRYLQSGPRIFLIAARWRKPGR
jgi:N-acetylglucosaminyldiphosphoundecaprenol N-acetyl-beta-D-mannosaminyltransferase